MPILRSEHRWVIIQREVVYGTIGLSVDPQVLFHICNNFLHVLADRLKRNFVPIIWASLVFYLDQVSAFVITDLYVVIDIISISSRSLQYEALSHRLLGSSSRLRSFL